MNDRSDPRRAAEAALARLDRGQLDAAPDFSPRDGRDRALALELFQGTLRHRVTIDCILDAFLRSGVRRTPTRTRHILEVALYQLLYLDRIPDHAAVGEAVAAAGGRKNRGFVNGVLRAILRELKPEGGQDDAISDSAQDATSAASPNPTAAPGSSSDEAQDVNEFIVGERRHRFGRPVFSADPVVAAAQRAGFSEESAELLRRELGRDRASELMGIANRRPRYCVRPHAGKLSAAELVERLKAEGREVEAIDDHPADSCRVDSLEGWEASALRREGLAVVQGDFAARVVPFMNLQAGECLVDFCSAPGGKAFQAAEPFEGKEGRVLAGVLDEASEARVRSGAKDLKLDDLEVFRHSGQPRAIEKIGDVSVVLLDVPCSNSGVLDRRAAARQRLDQHALQKLRKLQTRLLSETLECGRTAETPFRVVYSTCSVLPSENKKLVREVLEEFGASYQIEEEISAWPLSDFQDGGYAALLVPRVEPSQA